MPKFIIAMVAIADVVSVIWSFSIWISLHETFADAVIGYSDFRTFIRMAEYARSLSLYRVCTIPNQLSDFIFGREFIEAYKCKMMWLFTRNITNRQAMIRRYANQIALI